MQGLGVFGEYYYQINDDMKLTIGARWADETKDFDSIDASYSTAIDYAGIAYSGAALNIGDILRSAAYGVAAGAAFPVDFAVHNAALNRDLLSTSSAGMPTGTPAEQAAAAAADVLKAALKAGQTSPCSLSKTLAPLSL